MNSYEQKPPWTEIAEKASRETDPKKLLSLVEQLCAALDRQVKPRTDSAIRTDSRFDS